MRGQASRELAKQAERSKQNELKRPKPPKVDEAAEFQRELDESGAERPASASGKQPRKRARPPICLGQPDNAFRFPLCMQAGLQTSLGGFRPGSLQEELELRRLEQGEGHDSEGPTQATQVTGGSLL